MRQQKSDYDALLGRWLEMERSMSSYHRQLEEAKITIQSLQKELQGHPQTLQTLEDVRQELCYRTAHQKEMEQDMQNKIERAISQKTYLNEECDFMRSQMDKQSKTLQKSNDGGLRCKLYSQSL